MSNSCVPERPRIVSHSIPRGYPGTLATAGKIIRLIEQGKRDFCVRQQAIRVFRQHRVRPKDFLGEIAALFHWVRAHVRYTRDIHRVELLHSARRMLALRAGDCDDMVILLGAMLEATGHPVRLVLVGSNPRKPDLFTHIYLEVRYRDQWIPLDPTMHHQMGWAPRAVNRKVVTVAGSGVRPAPSRTMGSSTRRLSYSGGARGGCPCGRS
jgi:hypothetical protein